MGSGSVVTRRWNDTQQLTNLAITSFAQVTLTHLNFVFPFGMAISAAVLRKYLLMD